MENKIIDRGTTLPLVETKLEVDNFSIALYEELPAIVDFINKNFSDADAKFSNMATIGDMFNAKLAKAMFSITYWINHGDIEKVNSLTKQEDLARVKVEPVFEVLSDLIVDSIGFEYPSKDKIDIKVHMLNTYKLLRIMERAPYKFPLVLEDFKILRKFIRNNIRIVKPAGDLSMHSIDARSALLQEIRKFDSFYAVLKLELDEVIIDSKFRSYSIRLVGDDNEIKNLKRLLTKIPNLRVEILQKEDKKIYVKTKKECLEVNIISYFKK